MLCYKYQDEEAAGEEDEEEREDFSFQDLLGRDDEAVQCGSCDNCYCVACSELNNAATRSLITGGVVMWFCKHCNIVLPA